MIWLSMAVGVATGVISGFGVGGGSLLLLYLTAVQGMAQHAASGVNLLYFLACAPTALVSHIREKRVEWQAVGWCVLTGVATSVAGAFAASVIDDGWLRRLFGVLLLYVGFKELFFGCSRHKKVTKN